MVVGGVGAREWKALYWTEEKAPKINMFQVFNSGLYIPMAMSLFLFVNDFVYVCRLLTLVYLRYLVIESHSYELVMCFFLLFSFYLVAVF